MKNLAIIYHSGSGHTERIATEVAAGARTQPAIGAHLLQAPSLAPEDLLRYDGFVFGSPTYLGGVSGVFKTFMDSTGGLWKRQQLRGRLAAGFTVSALPSGDKQTTLLSLFVFAMQHGMVWVGNAIVPEQHSGVPETQAANRLGSWSGLMAQAGHTLHGEAFVPGDIRTARLFGAHVARSLTRLAREDVAP